MLTLYEAPVAPADQAEPPRLDSSVSSLGHWELLVALPILGLVTALTFQFACLLLAEWTLGAAAEAGAREALLPKATAQSVAAEVRRRLAGRTWAGAVDPCTVRVGGCTTVAAVLPRAGEGVTVVVSVDAIAVAPDLLAWMGLSLAGQKLSAERSRQMP